jgi:hypothetical protein
MLNSVKRLAKRIAHKDARQHDEIVYRIGLSAIKAASANYDKITRIQQADLQVFSQYGEDGIIDFLASKLNIDKPTFVEIGTEDYSESNTRFLFQRTSTKGMIIDCDPALAHKAKNVLCSYYWKGNLTIKSSFVTRENIFQLLTEGGAEWFNSDIFSLDIDGNDYWIMKDIISHCRHKIIILEYNPYFGPSASVTIPYTESFNRTDYHYSNLCWGASLKAFVSLLSENNYTFVGTNLNNSNGFWVRNDIFPQLGIEAPSISDLSSYTQNNCRESRSREGSLTFLAGNDRLKIIEDCLLVNLENHEKLQKISEIFSPQQ